MMALLPLYGWTIVAGSLMAVVLAWIGSQLASRGQSVQALVISQGSSLGVVGGLSLLHLFHPEHDHGTVPFFSWPMIGSLLIGAFSALICERVIKPGQPARNTYYIALFAALLSLTYLVTALVPSLESHMTSQFFGDLALISENAAKGTSIAVALVWGVLIYSWRIVTESSFDIATFGRILPNRTKANMNRLFVVVTLVTLCLSIQLMGLLFTISALFIVPVVVGQGMKSLKVYTFTIAVTAALGTVTGFVLSLWHGRLPTVPTIAFSFLVSGLLLASILKASLRRNA